MTKQQFIPSIASNSSLEQLYKIYAKPYKEMLFQSISWLFLSIL